MRNNLFDNIPAQLPEELVSILQKSPGVRIERIVSQGHQSPEGFWYDQDQHEWVIVLKGQASLQFENGSVDLKPGDFLNIPAHKKHRVAWTSPEEPTIWLAIFYAA